MADILVRGLSSAAVARFDAEAKDLGVSRAEVLRRHLEGVTPADEEQPVMTAQDWKHFAAATADLADPDVMAAAWR